jgi:hypothetical protein
MCTLGSMRETNVHISFENGILMCTIENMIFLWDSKYTYISFENGILMCTIENMIFLWDSKYTLVSTNVYIGSLMYTLVLPMYT